MDNGDIEKISTAINKLNVLCRLGLDTADADVQQSDVLYIMLDYINEIKSIVDADGRL